ncbi:small acid-soluble spore protein SspI [Paenibacillus apis]|uniref:Small, acid-soluble spore protein I n=1 Tax=Paenibacillus apis TaxID=1792174 RepID=A0A919Y7T9_9BACL|nr:small acid-soluble spore protein SspI [Paenibacillus apis]GIO43935.1 hypothetical protein J41TS4_36930 [Paenibacillus apis]
MPIIMDLRQAVMHKMHGQDEAGLHEMIEGSIGAQEAALPGLGVVFEMMWRNIDPAKQDEIVSLVHNQLEQSNLQPLK